MHKLVITALLLAACDKPSIATTNGETKTAEPAATESLGDKLNPYVDCLNSFTRDAFRGRHDWHETFGDKGPQPKQARETLYGPLALPDPKECTEGVARVKGEAPKLPELEAAGDAYVAAIAELQPLTAKLRPYFEQGDYKDDKLALAIRLHPKLVAAWDKLAKANDALEAQVDKLEDKLAADDLAELEKTSGKQLRWHHKRMLIQAKKLLAFVDEPGKDLAGLQAAVAAYDTAATELLAYATAHKEEKPQPLAYWTIESPVKQLQKDAKEMMRRQRDKTPYSDGERMTINANNAESVEGHPARVIAAYNSLIDTSNRMRW
jgi:uncharacterized protein DUF3829